MLLDPAVEQALQKLKPSIQAGSSYEAQQKVSCGTELAVLLLQALATDGVPADAAHVQQINKVLDTFPAALAAGPTASSQYEQVCVAAIKWAKQGGASTADQQELHNRAAIFFWDAGGPVDLRRASAHFARGYNVGGFARAIRQAAQEGELDEEDLFIVRAALQILAVRGQGRFYLQERVDLARGFFEVYAAEGPSPQTPLVHFLDLLLQALEKRSLLLVRLLRRQYAPSLARDEHLGALLDAIEAIHFHVVPPAAGMGGLLNNMLQMLASEDA